MYKYIKIQINLQNWIIICSFEELNFYFLHRDGSFSPVVIVISVLTFILYI